MNSSLPLEGDKRIFVREKEERTEKAMSIYENVVSDALQNGGPAQNGKTNESTVWYEYGCV